MNLSGKYPLFKGATRLPTFAGVPRTVIIATFIFCATLFMTIQGSVPAEGEMTP
ncbi:TPA: VirB3 family type IV secretion system protein [Klebsiella pneumoniae]|nr:VirB3 family type IV secretion system protein [Klebsiella pneumoniae]